MSRPEPFERFLNRIVVEETGCWIWQGAVVSGYGRLTIKRRGYYAHRLSHEWFKGAIPDGYHVDHLCHVRRCVNPDHLEAVTQAENNRRSPRTPYRSAR